MIPETNGQIIELIGKHKSSWSILPKSADVHARSSTTQMSLKCSPIGALCIGPLSSDY